MKRWAVLVLASTMFGGCRSQPVDAPQGQGMPPADLVLKNALIYTVDANHPWAEAVAIRGDTIVFVGSENEGQRFVGSKTKVLDLRGKMVLPGFIDSHTHLLVAAAMASHGLSLLAARDKEHALALLSEYAASHPEQEHIRGFGWKRHWFGKEGPHRKTLDAVDSKRPIELFDIGGQSSWLNSKALATAKISRHTQDPAPGVSYFVRNRRGEPTGHAIGLPAMQMHVSAIAPLVSDAIEGPLSSLLAHRSSAGVTTIYDAGSALFADPGAMLHRMQDRERKGQLPVRFYGALQTFDYGNDIVARFEELQATYRSKLVRAHGIDLIIDGRPENETAFLYAPYASNPEWKGMSLPTAEDLGDVVHQAMIKGINIHYHATGDAAVGMVADALEAAQARGLPLAGKHSLANSLLISGDDVERLAKLNVSVSSPGHTISTDAYAQALTTYIGERAEQTHRLQLLLDAGVNLSLGSDHPFSGDVVSYRPLDMLEVAHSRKRLGQPNAPLREPVGQRVKRTDLIRAATLGGALQLGIEDVVGSIETGKRADILVLDENLFDVRAPRVHGVKILMTLMNGQLVHRDPDVEFWSQAN